MDGGDQQQQQQQQQKSKIICNFFAMGGCSRGGSCRFSHELLQEAPDGVDASSGFFISGMVANYKKQKPQLEPKHEVQQNRVADAAAASINYWPIEHSQNSECRALSFLSYAAADSQYQFMSQIQKNDEKPPQSVTENAVSRIILQSPQQPMLVPVRVVMLPKTTQTTGGLFTVCANSTRIAVSPQPPHVSPQNGVFAMHVAPINGGYAFQQTNSNGQMTERPNGTIPNAPPWTCSSQSEHANKSPHNVQTFMSQLATPSETWKRYTNYSTLLTVPSSP